ncbi:hypothetical protein GCM10010191_59480 [Actinomadura vinacea]|uniref:OmpR/PhoB-type domain-containing protein n=1 Tax=Actinomadura vinacea TaxID=115336 RepID=A0ABN3JPU9_9ACTN
MPADQVSPIVQVGDYAVDLVRKTVSGPGEVAVHLTPIEWELLEILLRNPVTLVTQRRLLAQVWGPNHVKETNYLRVYMASLRRELEREPARPQHLITEPGMDHRFEP